MLRETPLHVNKKPCRSETSGKMRMRCLISTPSEYCLDSAKPTPPPGKLVRVKGEKMGCKQSREEGGSGVKFSQPVADRPVEPEAGQRHRHADPNASAADQSQGDAAETQHTSSLERNDSRRTMAHEQPKQVSNAAQTAAAADEAHPAPSAPAQAAPSKFKNGSPKITGGQEIACFQNGLLWRIVKDDLWAFYNDTQEYEMYVQFRFGPDSVITALGTTVITEEQDGWHTAKAIIYPGETDSFVKGKYNGYKSSIAAKPLSQEYRNRINAAANAVVTRELESVKKLARGSSDEGQILTACLAQKVPYVDLTFPPLQDALSRPKIDARQVAPTAWRRPLDFVVPEKRSEIAIFVGGASPNDIDQGQLGDCWLLCAIAAVAEFPQKIEDMFVHPISEKAAKEEQAIGAYRVIINKHGWWQIVVLDDFFPTVGSRQCFAHTVETPGELWVSLIEKAYAKLHGSYAAITGGDALQALQDLTGYPTHRFDTDWQKAAKDPSGADSAALFDKLVTYDGKGFLLNMNTPGQDNAAYMGKEAGAGNSADFEEMYKKAGLAMGHAYTCLAVKKFDHHHLRLIKIRNPWGNDVEWTGDWHDSDPSWDKYPDVANACGHELAADGTFWLTFEDALKYFDGGGVCFMMNDWFDYRVKGEFVAGYPSVVLEVSVTKPVNAFCIFSQNDKRGLAAGDPDSKYAAVMLSVVRSVGGDVSSNSLRKMEVHLNSTAYCDLPSKEYTFNYSRDLAMQYQFVPENSPYYVVPRVYDTGSNKHFTLGMISDVGADSSGLQIEFKTLDKSCRVFQNYPKFSIDTVAGVTPCNSAYQFNPEVGAPITKQGTRVVM